mgnify:CR=1 FL=1
MNVIKTTENGGMYICTMIGINKELYEKMANWGSYHSKNITKTIQSIAKWELVDNEIGKELKEFPKVAKVTSVVFRDADIDYVHKFAECQEEITVEILGKESADLKLKKLSALSMRMYGEMVNPKNQKDDEKN